MFKPLPRLIALCGHPKSGKSTAAEILGETFGYVHADDGLPLREIGMDHFGLTHQQCFTQDGKLEEIDLAGETMTARDLLGRIGRGFEAEVHPFTVPYLCWKRQAPHLRYVMSSVRRNQGAFWKSKGAIVVEIRNPDAGPSPYDFDQYNADLVDYTIDNDFLHLGMDEVAARKALADRLSVFLFNIQHRGAA